MSFSQDVRQALKRTILDKDQAFSCLYGILLYSRVFTSEQICLQSESETIVDLLPQLLHTVFSFPKGTVTVERGRGGLYSLSLQNAITSTSTIGKSTSVTLCKTACRHFWQGYS